ncbi:hypothetical protein CANMA_002566 [Candida margitis]|uniref:uncharacterized protein n=1 Tax=Candida margitis TaxID=1775924 RepID=UPI002227BFD7|nr:uncharacterized protein CANMA_002566 [Candida margitis]KAI5968143.1 hypothetical protein CANMA_002566 [Candida margitis]
MPFDPKTYTKYEFFTVSTLDEGVAHVQYTNPKTLNAYTNQNWKDYAEIITRLDKEEDISVIVISSGVAKSFSSGLNLKSAMEMGKPDSSPEKERIQKLHDYIIEFQNACTVPARINTPTIGILNGINYGLAIDLASAYSIRIGVEGARFSIAEVNIGIAADMGSLQRMPGIVNNQSRLFQHALLGDVFDVKEAAELGYVSTVVKSVEEGLQLAEEWGSKMAQVPQWAIKGTKKHIQDILNGTTTEQGLLDIADYNAKHIARGSVFASSIQQTRDSQIKNELIMLTEQKSFKKLANLLETWSMHDIDGMVKTLGRETLAQYLNLIIKENRKRYVKKFSQSPIQKSSRSMKITDKQRDPSDFIVEGQLTRQIRNTYRNLIYNSRNEHFYHKERSQDIYSGNHLTGYKLTPSDFENLMELELGNYKLDLASRWFHIFCKQYDVGQWKQQMTPKLWTLAFKIDGMGDNKFWTIKATELSSYYKNPLRSRFKPRMKFGLSDVKYGLYDLDLEFHTAVIQSLAYAGQLNDMKSYVSRIWNVDKNGNSDSLSTKVSRESHLYPNTSLLTALFVSLAYNGEFFAGIKYINAFQLAYDQIENVQRDNKVFWEQVFKWANISTLFEENQALKYFLTKSNYSRGTNVDLKDAQNDASFDYEGYLQFIESLKSERVKTFDQLWKIVQNDEEQLPFSTVIYKTYLDVLKENEKKKEQEQKLFDYLSCLLKEYMRHNIRSNSFTKRSGLGFVPTNDKSVSIRVLYTEAMKSLIDVKGTTTFLGQMQPLIDKWSIDESMKNDLQAWTASRMPIYRKDLEAKREEFMNNLTQDDESLLELM